MAEIGADGVIASCNEAFQAMVGAGPLALIGQAVSGWLHPDDLSTEQSPACALTGAEPVVQRYRHRDGHWVAVRAAVSTLMGAGSATRRIWTMEILPSAPDDTDDHLRAANEVLRAYTELLLEQQDELGTAYLELQRLNSVKDEFLSIISHELRTPLAVMSNVTAILMRGKAGPLNETQDRFVRMMKQHIERLNRMVDDILDLQKLAIGKMEFRLVIGDIRPLLTATAASFVSLYEERGVSLVIALPEFPLPASHDADKLAQVLVNLLGNALKFTPEDGTVVLRGGADGQEVWFAVSDSGVGIDEADFERIFHGFVQVDGSPTRGVGGIGLGLTICRRLIEEGHGGRIDVRSTIGQGSTFTVRLPIG